MSNFEPEILWEVYNGGQTFESFCENIIPKMAFNKNVPEEIQLRMTGIRKLLEHSYYEYCFIDIAMERCFTTFELALHKKHKLVHPGKEGLKNFKPYMSWAVSKKYLNMTEDQKKHIEYLRNTITHPKEVLSLGIMSLSAIRVVEELINDLYTSEQNLSSIPRWA